VTYSLEAMVAPMDNQDNHNCHANANENPCRRAEVRTELGHVAGVRGELYVCGGA